jgi:pseudouridine-5'-monophosphatase
MAGAALAEQSWCRGILFDLDGTLLDSEPVYFAAFKHAATTLGRSEAYSWDFHVAHVNGRPERACLDNFRVQLDLEDVPPERVLELRNEHALAHFPHCAVLPGVHDAIAAFKARGLPLAIATSSARKGSTFGVKTESKGALLGEFDVVLCVDDEHMAGKQGKPAPDIFLAAARLLDVPIDACIVFEDSMAGIRAGVASGAFVVAVPDRRMKAAALAEGAHLVLDSLEQVDFAALLGPCRPRHGCGRPAAAASAGQSAASTGGVSGEASLLLS